MKHTDTRDGFERIDVAAAKVITERILPGASVLSPDKIYEVATGLGLEIEFIKCAHLHSMSQAEAFDTVFAGVSIPESVVFLVADVLLPNAFTYTGADIRSLILQVNEYLFDLDTVFVWPEAGLISVVHHEGAYFHVIVKK